MLFHSTVKYTIILMIILLVLQGIDITFHFGYEIFLFIIFWLIFTFELGIYYGCRYIEG